MTGFRKGTCGCSAGEEEVALLQVESAADSTVHTGSRLAGELFPSRPKVDAVREIQQGKKLAFLQHDILSRTQLPHESCAIGKAFWVMSAYANLAQKRAEFCWVCKCRICLLSWFARQPNSTSQESHLAAGVRPRRNVPTLFACVHPGGEQE